MRPRGFTLIELLLAMGIFGLVAVMAYGGLNTVLDARETTERQADRLAEVERAILFMGRDITQTVARGVRDELGDPLPALLGGEGAAAMLELTRAGWSNPTDRPRGILQRVAWGMEDATLERAVWQVLDRAQDSEPLRVPMLTGVREVQVRFLDGGREWQTAWPPAVDSPPALPLAVSVSIELEDWGIIERLWSLPGGGA